VRSQQESIAAPIPGARLIVYAGAGHGHHWEGPRRAAIDIAAFLDGMTPGTRRIASTPTEPKLETRS
jgi:hypothetical protein